MIGKQRAMVGQQAPGFVEKAVIQGQVKKISLDDFHDTYKVIFFYPKDFTYVCPTELHAFQELLPEFEKRNVQVIGCSVDDCATHCKWMETPKRLGGIEGIAYPLVADTSKQMTRDYGVLDEKAGVAFRGVFILDKKNIVQSVMINNLSLGRNVHEILRLVEALQFVEKHGQVCPANWVEGEPAMTADKEGLLHFFDK